ncbi:MAG: hypothetical protein GF411_06125, partial [Candidatus Lokiarchaeota archaeon]|nr:hypothetical protein [Candidatus Woesearchaeota archaeon]MBD3405693.1 hypothetical protein [Candidatus Lokiarchaeota archaeon]
MIKKIILILIVLVTLTGSVLGAYCRGGVPHSFSGSLTVDGKDAQEGTQIRGIIEGEVKGQDTTQNPGEYFLGVQGELDGYDEAPEIVFEVYLSSRWVDTGERATYECGEVSELDIDAETPEIECYDDSDCDDGLYCNGQETCVNDFCVDGTAVECSSNSIDVDTCEYIPDNNSLTYDSYGFTSICDEESDSCTQPPVDWESIIAHECSYACGA